MTRMRALGILLIPIFLVLDQLSKWAVLEHVFRPALGIGQPMRFADWIQFAPERLSDISLTYTSFFNLTMVWNSGISFGLLSGGGAFVLTLMACVIACVFFAWLLKSREKPEILALSMIIGGALGNVIDRLRFGAVADFLDFHLNTVHFPAFNLADALISVGVALLVIHGLFFAKVSP